MRALLSTLILPLPFFTLFLLGAALAWRYRRKRLAKWFGIAAVVWLALITTAPLPCWLVCRLEEQYPPRLVYAGGQAVDAKAFSPIDSTLYIAVLGGGHTLDPRLPPAGQLSPNALARLIEGVRLHRLFPGSRLVFSGWSSTGAMSTAEVGARAAASLGVDPTAIEFLPEPWNTRTEGLAFAERFGTDARLLLVTSAVHMPRAVMHFRNAGLDPVPAPTDFRCKDDEQPNSKPWNWLKPSAGNVERMEVAVHEYAGMVWAWLGGD